MSNRTQVGGDHYAPPVGAQEHWDRIFAMYGRGYFVGCATKYLERYHLKGGAEDLKKAISFTQKLLGLEFPGEVSKGQGLQLKHVSLNGKDYSIEHMGGDDGILSLQSAIQRLEVELKQAYGKIEFIQSLPKPKKTR